MMMIFLLIDRSVEGPLEKKQPKFNVIIRLFLRMYPYSEQIVVCDNGTGVRTVLDSDKW